MKLGMNKESNQQQIKQITQTVKARTLATNGREQIP